MTDGSVHSGSSLHVEKTPPQHGRPQQETSVVQRPRRKRRNEVAHPMQKGRPPMKKIVVQFDDVGPLGLEIGGDSESVAPLSLRSCLAVQPPLAQSCAKGLCFTRSRVR